MFCNILKGLQCYLYTLPLISIETILNLQTQVVKTPLSSSPQIPLSPGVWPFGLYEEDGHYTETRGHQHQRV